MRQASSRRAGVSWNAALHVELHPVTVSGEDRRRLEQLCRDLLRPPIAQDRLTLRPDGTVVVLLKTPWRDGTTHLCFEPARVLQFLKTHTPDLR
jgi:Putative transposase